MTLSSVWKRLPRASRRVATTTSDKTASRSSDCFESIVVEPHHGKPDSSPTTASAAKSACPRLKSKMLALVWRSSKNQEPSTQDTRKQAWQPDDAPEDDSSKVHAEKNGTAPKLQCQEDSPDDVELDTACPTPSSLAEADTGVEQKTLAQLAREARMFEGQSLAEIAAEAMALARQEMDELPHEQQAQDQPKPEQNPVQEADPIQVIQALEREWTDSMFVDFEYEHRQQLRRVIGLPRQPRNLEEACP